MTRLSLILIALLLSACASRPAAPNMPDRATPNQMESAQPSPDRHREVWVDADGTFFPAEWEARCGGHRSGAYTLLDRALSSNYPDCTPELLRQTRGRVLSNIATEFGGLEMVTIMVHGFNHDVRAANDDETPSTSIRHDYNQRRNAIDRLISQSAAGGASHGYIDFFWNGLATPGGLIAAPIAWRYASINGERAGHLALQPILATLQDAGVQHVHILAHSRGAAVALSALAGGKYVDEDGRARNAALGAPNPSTPLTDGGMEILVTSTAPAIGRWHFNGGQNAGVRSDDPVRPLPASVISHYSTVNSRDFALRKLVGGILVRRFNSTAFGQNLRVAQGVADRMNGARVNASREPYFVVTTVDPARDQLPGSAPVRRSTHDATAYLNTCQVMARLARVYNAPFEDCPN